MSFSFFGIPVSNGIAIGRAIVLASDGHQIDHYYIKPEQKQEEIQRLIHARDVVLQELQLLQQQLPKDTPAEVSAILEVHMMILNDTMLHAELRKWIDEHHYNAEWALDSQLKVFIQHFDEMEDEYLRQRGSDLEHITQRLQKELLLQKQTEKTNSPSLGLQKISTEPLIIVAHDITATDMLHFKRGALTGFITDIGGQTSHSAIIARSMSIPALVGARNASQLIHQDDLLIIDSHNGVVIVNPASLILEEYKLRQCEQQRELEQLHRLKNTPAITLDEQPIELLANIELPNDAARAKKSGAQGIGLFRSEFLFMSNEGNNRKLPDEEEQYQAYKTVLEQMPKHPVTIRTIDIGADKPLSYDEVKDTLNPALGLRAIRWSLADPDIFLTQLRALLRASVHGNLHILIPMLTHEWQIKQTLVLIEKAKASLKERSIAFDTVSIGAMIEVPAAVLTLPIFLKYFDFLSVGTNDLIQYTLAVDRADETVAHLFDSFHPAVLKLIAQAIAQCNAAGKKISICGEMAGDIQMTRLLLGLGLRSFSMHPAQILAVKNELLRCDGATLAPLAQAVINAASMEEQEVALQALQLA